MRLFEAPALVLEVMRYLPPLGSVWPHEERDEFIKALTAAINLTYGPPYIDSAPFLHLRADERVQVPHPEAPVQEQEAGQ